MDVTKKIKKPMSKDEVAYFVELIQKYPILLSKETNAATNKLKEDAWVSMTAAFNAHCGSFPKDKAQLKLKWDNLKKGARKRTQQIRMNNLKTGGGKPDFIPPDEVLEKVAVILGATCTGFMVPFGGDAVPFGGDGVPFGGVGVSFGGDGVPLDDGDSIQHYEVVPNASNCPTPTTSRGEKPSEVASKTYGMPAMAKPLLNKGKKRKFQDDGRKERNMAIAKYYNIKAEIAAVELEILKANKEVDK